MAGTFITQQNFNDLDACMAQMASLEHTLHTFNKELGGNAHSRPQGTLLSAINEGKAQARSWGIKTDSGYFTTLDEHTQQIVNFTDYLVSQANAAHAENHADWSGWLDQVALPPHLLPKALGLQVHVKDLVYFYQVWLALMADKLTASGPGYDALRHGIYRSIPRVTDYMNQRLSSPHAAPFAQASSHARALTRHYLLGMTASANFNVQYKRIIGLLYRASRLFSAWLDTRKTLMEGSLALQLLAVELRHAQKFCKELIALRTGK